VPDALASITLLVAVDPAPASLSVRLRRGLRLVSARAKPAILALDRVTCAHAYARLSMVSNSLEGSKRAPREPQWFFAVRKVCATPIDCSSVSPSHTSTMISFQPSAPTRMIATAKTTSSQRGCTTRSITVRSPYSLHMPTSVFRSCDVEMAPKLGPPWQDQH